MLAVETVLNPLRLIDLIKDPIGVLKSMKKGELVKILRQVC